MDGMVCCRGWYPFPPPPPGALLAGTAAAVVAARLAWYSASLSSTNPVGGRGWLVRLQKYTPSSKIRSHRVFPLGGLLPGVGLRLSTSQLHLLNANTTLVFTSGGEKGIWVVTDMVYVLSSVEACCGVGSPWVPIRVSTRIISACSHVTTLHSFLNCSAGGVTWEGGRGLGCCCCCCCYSEEKRPRRRQHNHWHQRPLAPPRERGAERGQRRLSCSAPPQRRGHFSWLNPGDP
mmetsp:Transcript_35669/g.60299  ORF Transcript_35669/g.60299 Transcript_35669/m.60299 type:complete len:233 (+) Transcript_35669:87-785(+)